MDEQLLIAELDPCGSICDNHRFLQLKDASDKEPQRRSIVLAQEVIKQPHGAGCSLAQMSCAVAGRNTHYKVGAGCFEAQRIGLVNRYAGGGG